MTNLEKQTHDAGSLFVVSANPVAMALFKSPGAYNADIVTGEGQSLGIPISYGGPYYGLFASRMEYVRQIPGRIAGRTVDARGDTGYVLTLSAREQHIRRERATSNICTNQALMTLASTVYMAIMGKEGLRQAAELCYHKAHYAASLIDSLSGYSVRSDRVFFNEFVVNCLRSALTGQFFSAGTKHRWRPGHIGPGRKRDAGLCHRDEHPRRDRRLG